MFNRIALSLALVTLVFFCGISWDMNQIIRVSAENADRLVEEAQIMKVTWQHCAQGEPHPRTITAEGSDVPTFEANLAYLENKFPNNCP